MSGTILVKSPTLATWSSFSGWDGDISFAVPAWYYNGSEFATAVDSDLIAGNVKNGVDIFGVVGTLSTAWVGLTSGYITSFNNSILSNVHWSFVAEVAYQDSNIVVCIGADQGSAWWWLTGLSLWASYITVSTWVYGISVEPVWIAWTWWIVSIYIDGTIIALNYNAGSWGLNSHILFDTVTQIWWTPQINAGYYTTWILTVATTTIYWWQTLTAAWSIGTASVRFHWSILVS